VPLAASHVGCPVSLIIPIYRTTRRQALNAARDRLRFWENAALAAAVDCLVDLSAHNQAVWHEVCLRVRAAGAAVAALERGFGDFRDR
jgi:hypothetical protein